jgi:formylglycine-generating enzyme required for sulfatase activity
MRSFSLHLKSVILCIILLPFFTFAQENDFKNYTRELEGTDLKFDMIAIPGGTFNMGSPPTEVGRRPDEGPQHQVKISPFWMGKHEVTWDFFEPFVYKNQEISRSKIPLKQQVDALTRPTKPYVDMTWGMGKEGFPAIGMTQYAAIQFCKWLYARTGEFYRLPTEAEWEYASRAGTTGAYSHPADSKLDEYAWYKTNSSNKTHPVGSKKPNPWGLHDMHGNVTEWTYDQYKPDGYTKFAGAVVQDPIVPFETLYPNSVRGGSYEDPATDLRSASRRGSLAEWKQIDPQIPKSNWWLTGGTFVGIRVVRPLVTPSKEEIEKYYNREPIADF